MAFPLLLSFSLATLSTGFTLDSWAEGDGTKRDRTGCPAAWMARCSCGLGFYRQMNPNKKQFISNCTNSGFTDPTVMQYTPRETEVLIFNGNNFETLSWNMLGIWRGGHKDLMRMEVLDLTNNRIKEIQSKFFHKVNGIRRLILNHNDLYIVSTMSTSRVFSNFENLEELHLTDAFTEQRDFKWYLNDLRQVFLSNNLRRLKKLHLEQNEIWGINDTFCEMPELLDLHLGDNQLSDINFSVSCLKKLRYLDLEYNKIRTLTQETLDKLDKVYHKNLIQQIDLHGNPYNCDCNLNPLVNWLKVTKVHLVNKKEMRCYDGLPAYNAGKRIVNVEELDCPTTIANDDNDDNADASQDVTSTIIKSFCITARLLGKGMFAAICEVAELYKNSPSLIEY